MFGYRFQPEVFFVAEATTLLLGSDGGTFEEELAARDAMIIMWEGLKKDAPSNNNMYLDDLIRIRQSGFLPEYIWVYYRDLGWNSITEQPSIEKSKQFETWAKENLMNHIPETRVLIKWKEKK